MACNNLVVGAALTRPDQWEEKRLIEADIVLSNCGYFED